MQTKSEKIPAAIEFKRRFPDTWESFSDEQKKHVVYAMNGWRALEQLEPEGEVSNQGAFYANENWSVLDNPNEHDNARDDFIAGAKWMRSKLTPQQPSEGRIINIWDKYCETQNRDEADELMTFNEFEAAIKELLNQKR